MPFSSPDRFLCCMSSLQTVRNLEKDKTRLNNDKLLVEDELKTKQQELKQCKQVSWVN